MSAAGRNLTVFFGVLVPALAASFGWLASNGLSDDSLVAVLRLTARASFMLYLLVFVARPLRQLFNTRLTRWLLKQRRLLGVAFAAMHSAHLALIACRFTTIPGLEYPLSSALFGGTAYALMYLMLITSFDGPARAIGPRAWRILHKIGLYFIGFIFLATLLPEPGTPFLTIERAWFVSLTVLALLVRLTAWLARRR